MFVNQYNNHFLVSRRLHDPMFQEREHDCFVVNLMPSLSSKEIESIAVELAQTPCGWIEVIGFDAEQIHDAIDTAAVVVGRQDAAGEGDPMTTWDSQSTISFHEIAKYLWTGGQGTSDLKRVLVVGDENAEASVLAAIQSVAL